MRSLKHQLIVFVLLCVQSTALAQTGTADRWVGTWATAEVGRPQNPVPPAPPLPPFMINTRCAPPATPPVAPPPGQTFAPLPFAHFTNQTLRQIVHTTVGGSKARVVLSNAYGTAPATVGAAHIALRDKEGAIQAASGRPLTFSGRPTHLPGAFRASNSARAQTAASAITELLTVRLRGLSADFDAMFKASIRR